MKLMKKLENMFAASAFAEAGEFDTAREMAKEPLEKHQTAKPEAASRRQADDRGGVRPSSTSA